VFKSLADHHLLFRVSSCHRPNQAREPATFSHTKI
jgi:hypothetical protein